MASSVSQRRLTFGGNPPLTTLLAQSAADGGRRADAQKLLELILSFTP
jgi:hypothetical protein